VERTLAWLSKCRGLLVRYERKSENYLAQLQFACALLWCRRCPIRRLLFHSNKMLLLLFVLRWFLSATSPSMDPFEGVRLGVVAHSFANRGVHLGCEFPGLFVG